MQSSNHCSFPHPPLNAAHHAACRQRAVRGHDTGQSRRITWRERARRAEGRKGARAPGPPRVRTKERKRGERRERGGRREILRVPRGEVLGLACPGMASSHSSVFTVRGHPRARATFGFSTSSLSREASARVADADGREILMNPKKERACDRNYVNSTRNYARTVLVP